MRWDLLTKLYNFGSSNGTGQTSLRPQSLHEPPSHKSLKYWLTASTSSALVVHTPSS